jgi:hypothetical protein
VGYEQVYRNGVLLSRGNDYTATNGTTVTLTDATVTGDIIEIFANELVPLADAISKGQFTAKGSLLSASAASTPAVLAVGSNNQVLTADSSTTTGLKWATPSAGAGNLVEIATGTLSGASVTISSLSTYSELLLFIYDSYNATADGTTQVRINNNSTSNYDQLGYSGSGAGNSAIRRSLLGQTSIQAVGTLTQNRADAQDLFTIRFFNTKNAGFTSFDVLGYIDGASGGDREFYHSKGIYKVSEAVSSLVIYQTGGNWSGGTYTLWGG